MPSPFPGMDPYLEAPGLWPDVHNSLIASIRDELSPRLFPRYYVALEERYLADSQELVFVGRPDLAVVAGARRSEELAPKQIMGSAVVEVAEDDAVEPPPRRRCSASWARLIVKVYHVDPLVCVRCGQRMSILAFVSDQSIGI